MALPRDERQRRAIAFLKEHCKGRQHQPPFDAVNRPVVKIYFDPSRGRDRKAKTFVGYWSFPDWALGPHIHTNALAIELRIHVDAEVVHKPANLPVGVEAHRR